MAKPADFMVVLRNDIEPQNIALLRPVIRSLTLADGLVANVLWCKSVDLSGQYLSVEAKLSSGDGFAHVQIPHFLVLTIAGSKNAPPMGFLWESESNKQPQELE